MISRSLALGLLAAGCVAASAGGAYVAVRQNAAEPAPAVAVAAQPAAVTPQQPVAETEAVVAPLAPAGPATPAANSMVERTPDTRPAARTEASRPAPAASSRSAATRTRAARQQERPAPAVQPAPAAPPVSAASTPVEPPGAAREAAPAPPVAPADAAPEPAREIVPPSPAEPKFEEVTLPASAVIGLQIESPVSSERAQLEDRVTARVTRDVMAQGLVAIPAGARVIGSVTLVERGGKVKERARLGVRFHTLVLADGTELPLRTEPIFREGESPVGDSTRKIGGAAVGGAILGAILGGGKGAVIGGATGAAGGTAAVMAGDRNAATLPTGAIVTVRLSAPVDVQIEKR